ncbi:Hypothetical protein OINT_2001082 [Brucella intermedia LMG 3301]|uniref:Uncharacterized protein n=1 Tax=Brucella intermedia LMG 3301 TaxID=641118 RepID=C4WND7_9HYPH|nr:Hypothetical protein OINT_2001082 [Brucella intermedia LMG 3301]
MRRNGDRHIVVGITMGTRMLKRPLQGRSFAAFIQRRFSSGCWFGGLSLLR